MLEKCPRCELNYIKPGEKLCCVCKKQMHGEDDLDVMELCTECNERPAVEGEELCSRCLRRRRADAEEAEVEPNTERGSEENDGSMDDLDLDSMDEMDSMDDLDVLDDEEMDEELGQEALEMDQEDFNDDEDDEYDGDTEDEALENGFIIDDPNEQGTR